MTLARHLRAIALLPFVATVVVPAALVPLTSRRRTPEGSALAQSRRVAGAALVAAGLTLFVWTVRLFATAGRGTLAPWDPTERLVVRGPYRHVRNPMITGVLCVLLGESVLLRSPAVLGWAALFVAANAVYMPLVEERDMERRFGGAYLEYKRNVPRWLPRATPWPPDGA